ncbi:MAG TPA: outer membrane beta-barrel protein [Gemmatimonadota bacterium]|nr:outer membrane beta-barrel protein [Gemmatimonadota bacterium]
MRRALPPNLALAVLLWLVSAAGAAAQPGDEPLDSGWELNLHAAALRPDLFDESSGALQFGGRIVGNFANGLSVGGNVDWAAPNDVTVAPFGGMSAKLLLLSADIEYRVPVSPRAVFFFGAGAGAATLSLDDAPVGVTESSTGLLIPVGAGFKVYNRSLGPTWALRFDVRDNVILLETLNLDGGTDTEPRNNIEASAGFSFLFGAGSGRREAAAEARDTDRDGIPDPRDFCLNRPGLAVDARGCPLEPEGQAPEPDLEPAAQPDADLDGVPDSVAPAVEAPPAAAPTVEAPPGDSDGDGVVDAADACPGTPAGLPIDERGCLARQAPREEAAEPPAVRPVPEALEPREVAPPAEDVRVPEAEVPGACLDPSAALRTFEFDGRRFQPAGFPQPVDRQFLVRVGEYEGMPIYVSDTAREPYTDFWVPRCGPGSLFELYVEAGSIP